MTLQSITEASLTVDTGGGDLNVGTVKAITAKLATCGGSLSGSVTAGGVCSLACIAIAVVSSLNTLSRGAPGPEEGWYHGRVHT